MADADNEAAAAIFPPLSSGRGEHGHLLDHLGLGYVNK